MALIVTGTAHLYARRSIMHKNIGEFLAAAGCHEAIAYASLGRAVIVKPWHSEAGLPNGTVTPAEFAARYTFRNDGFHDGTDPGQAGVDQGLFTAGSLCGHDVPTQNQFAIASVAIRSDNPFQLEANFKYLLTVQDLLDLEYVKDPTEEKPVWLTIWPRLAGVPTLTANQGWVMAPAGQVASGLTPGEVPKYPLPAPISADEATRRSGALFATVWPNLRKALQEQGFSVDVAMRHAILDAFDPLILAAAQAGVIAEDGTIGGGA